MKERKPFSKTYEKTIFPENITEMGKLITNNPPVRVSI